MSHPAYLSEQLHHTVTVKKGKGVETLYPYFADDELRKAINLALFLNRPLLIMGEPGCGKSLLAKAIAYEWYGDQLYEKEKYFEWNIKSTSKAREGLYEYDHLLRLRDANLKTEGVDMQDRTQYRSWGPMANAIMKSKPDEKCVLLIDEIDKADIDFSNDLLNELERNSFYVPETGEDKSFDEQRKPFIVITSNGEKDLSDAFLRRCIFHYIDMFSSNKLDSDNTRTWLERILKARFYDETEADNVLIEKAVKTFVALRQNMNSASGSYRKLINTSEFIDWFAVMKACRTKEGIDLLENDTEFEEWVNNTPKGNKVIVPFGNVLFKTTSSLFNFRAIDKSVLSDVKAL